MRLRVGTYNLLCPTYGVKWGEREACLDWRSKDEHGLSNWEQRWPALRPRAFDDASAVPSSHE